MHQIFYFHVFLEKDHLSFSVQRNCNAIYIISLFISLYTFKLKYKCKKNFKNIPGIELTIELKLLDFFHQYYFVTFITCNIQCVETSKLTNILYVIVRINGYDQSEY